MAYYKGICGLFCAKYKKIKGEIAFFFIKLYNNRVFK